MKVSKDVQAVIRYGEERGFKIVRAKKHIIMRNEEGAVVTLSRSPSCPRTAENCKKEFDNAAYKISIQRKD